MVNQKASKALLVFSIGPVQSFIATSRRTQDLYVSSALLSYLARIGVEAAESVGATAIYPVKTGKGEWPASIPNRFVVETDLQGVEHIASAIERAIRREWLLVADNTRDYFATLAPQVGWQAVWKRQVDGWLETYWAAWQWSEQENYGKAFQRAGFALDARKRIRTFPVEPEPGEKCTLSGIHEALGPGERERPHVREFWKKIRSSKRVTPAELRDGERLSAISTIKRFAAKEEAGVNALRHKRFPSTSSIALASFRKALLEQWDKLADVVTAHLDALEALGVQRFADPEPFPHLNQLAKTRQGAERLMRYDGDFFYLDTFEPKRIKEALGSISDEATHEAKRQHALGTLTKLRNAATQLNIAPPHIYLATLVLDGDGMGKLLGKCESPAQHRKISQALANFAETTVRTIVEIDHPGRLVYAGGDDVLALLPVRAVLDVANQLQRAFSAALSAALETTDEHQAQPTASAGIAISHHVQPLEGALRAARGAEHAAKDRYDRNALVIDVVRRSGEKQRIGIKWSAPDQDVTDALAPLLETQQLMEIGMLSGKIAYDLKAECIGLEKIPKALQVELQRLFKRHLQDEPSNGICGLSRRVKKEIDVNALATKWAQLAKLPAVSVETLAGWLQLVRFLAQSGEE